MSKKPTWPMESWPAPTTSPRAIATIALIRAMLAMWIWYAVKKGFRARKTRMNTAWRISLFISRP